MKKLIVILAALALAAVPTMAAAAPPGGYSATSESAHAFIEGETEGSFFFAGLDAGSWEFVEPGYSEAWSGVSFFFESYSETGYIFCYASDESDVALDRRLTGLTVDTTLSGECFVSVDDNCDEPPGDDEPVEGEEASVEHDNGEGPGEEVVAISVTVTATWTGVGTLSRNSWTRRGDEYVCKGSSLSRDASVSATVEIEAEGLELPAIDFSEAYAGLDRWSDSCHEKGSPGPA